MTTAVARAATEVGRCVVKPFCIGFGDSTGGFDSKLSVSSDGNVFSLPSLGLSDSVEPLFLSERVVGRSSSNRASSICRRDIWPLSSSRRLFQSGTDVQRVFRASTVEYVAIGDIVSPGDAEADGRIKFSAMCVAGKRNGTLVNREDESSNIQIIVRGSYKCVMLKDKTPEKLSPALACFCWRTRP